LLIAPAIVAFGAAGAAVLTSACQAIFLAGVWAGRDRGRRGSTARVGTADGSGPT
jgi:hypothetical protein